MKVERDLMGCLKTERSNWLYENRKRSKSMSNNNGTDLTAANFGLDSQGFTRSVRAIVVYTVGYRILLLVETLLEVDRQAE